MQFEERRESNESYLKVGPGEKIRGIFRGTPHTFKTHWTGNKSELCTGPDNCALCTQGDRARFRFKVNFIVKDGNAYVAKVFEQSFRVYDIMRSLHMELTEQKMGLDKVVVTIARNGSGKDTTYTITPVFGPAGQVNAELERTLAKVPLNALVKGGEDDDDGEDAEAPAHAEEETDDIPF